MTPWDEMIGQAMFDRLKSEAKRLDFADLLILKSALNGKVAYRELPDKLREGFARLGAVGSLSPVKRG